MSEVPRPPERPEGRGARVLIVDDNPVLARATASMLASLGAEADLAADGFAALASLARTPYDLVLLDWEMPRLDGRRTALEIRRRYGPSVPVVVISALTARVRRVLGPGSGVDDVLAKPFDHYELEALLARWVRPASPLEPEPPR